MLKMVMVVVVIVMVVMMIVMAVLMGGVIMVMFALLSVGTGGVRDEVEKGVSEETARRKTQQDLQKLGVFARILQRNEKENEEWSSTHQPCREQRVDPELTWTIKPFLHVS